NIKKDLERFKLINFEVRSKIIIREEQIIQYYKRHKAEFNIKGTVHLASIFLVRKNPEDEDEMRELQGKAKDILTRLREGQDFGALAREFSQGPGADEGGDLGSFKTSDLEPKLQKILETMPEGGISDLIIRANGIQIIKLIKKQAGKERPFEEVRNSIYAILLKEEINKRYKLWINELRERSYTKIIF
ncbi:MAG: peptidyl-prolyl cis-trans isomerase, partial [Thermodesulfobacteriota bacterium]|nr:peptidyl-prolyl cis-trans isomerase [Thermodesulfobacteriota bacterium]